MCRSNVSRRPWWNVDATISSRATRRQPATTDRSPETGLRHGSSSPRTQSALFKFDVESGELLWKLGKNGDFARSDGESGPAFLRQHAPELQSDGNILVFDNGSRNRPYSRAVEISYDTEAMTYEVAWAYRPDPDIYAPIWGDADRLENGNTLAVFGRRDKEKGSIIQEVTGTKEVVFDLRIPKKWGWYRAERISVPELGYSIAGE